MAPALVAVAFDHEFRLRVLLQCLGIFNEVLPTVCGEPPAVECEIDVRELMRGHFTESAWLDFWDDCGVWSLHDFFRRVLAEALPRCGSLHGSAFRLFGRA